MIFYLIGVSRRSAEDNRYLHLLKQKPIWEDFSFFDEGLIARPFLTCSRMEFYGIASDSDALRGRLDSWRRTFGDLGVYGYQKIGTRGVFSHVLSLACGLESGLLGEKEILTQLESWILTSVFDQRLGKFLDSILEAARSIRLRSGIEERDVSFSGLIYRHLKEIGFKGYLDIVVLGTGKLALSLAEARPHQVRLSFVSRKHFFRAQALAQESGGEAFHFKQLSRALKKADILIAATQSPHPVLIGGMLSEVPRNREKMLHVFDFGVPGNIALSDLRGLVYNDYQYWKPVCEKENDSVAPLIERAKFFVHEQIQEDFGEESDQNRHAPEPVGIEAD